jgi:hypothetical protein
MSKTKFVLSYLPFLLALIFGSIIAYHRFHPRPNGPSKTPLTRSIEAYDVKGVERLLNGGANPRRPLGLRTETEDRTFPISYAVWSYGNALYRKDPDQIRSAEQIIDLLLKHGADINESSPYRGYSGYPLTCISPCLSIAVSRGNIKLYRFLIDHGANPRIGCSNGPTLFFSLGMDLADQDQVIQELVKAGVDINRQDPDGRTALHYAVRSHNPELTRLLVSHGAKVNVKDCLGLSPLDFENDRECEKVLLAAGAKPGDQF